MDNNFLSPIGFAFKVSNIPNVNFMVQGVRIPGMSLGSANMPTPFVPIHNPGNLQYGDLSVTFKVSADLTSYLEIFNWMNGLSRPDNYEQYKAQIPKQPDGTVIIYTGNKRAFMHAEFTNIFPTSISDLDFDSALTDVPYVPATATFSFDRMYFKPL